MGRTTPQGSAPALHCSQSHYGCCPDGRTSAGGPQGLGCPRLPAPVPVRPHCAQTRYHTWRLAPGTHRSSERPLVSLVNTEVTTERPEVFLDYGCCQDGATASRGPDREGCVERPAAPAAAPSLPAENGARCRLSTYGCCYDRSTPAGGPTGESCPRPPNHSKTRPVRPDISMMKDLHGNIWLILSTGQEQIWRTSRNRMEKVSR
ncbi:Papilin [Liparis tanakae]|uniref:Papilin n=1 Tax=Liparis tanakae TaxID=230148 RepID=A0A4Z2EL27_9TELE|nr:Papilin [Liparis tanakae]